MNFIFPYIASWLVFIHHISVSQSRNGKAKKINYLKMKYIFNFGYMLDFINLLDYLKHLDVHSVDRQDTES